MYVYCPPGANDRAVFIPDPGRWAVVTFDMFVVHNVLGWRYDPVTDLSAPVVSTRKMRGATSLRWDSMHVLLPVWPGIEFGSTEATRSQALPEGVRKILDRVKRDWSVNL